METRLIVLKLFLDELGIPDNIDTVDDRVRVQKAVYLGQSSGVDLGYRFGWYVRGPYSPALARDYYSLAEAIASGDTDYREKELREPIRSRLREIRPLLEVPNEIPLTKEGWLELVASLHYLLRVRNHTWTDALKILASEKPHLHSYANQAQAKLRDVLKSR